MILVGSQRSGAKALALHLLKEENEHVEVHELRGFASENLVGALNETYAISRGTRCKQYLYSLSLNPPPGEKVPTAAFEDAIARIEDRLGLSDQPRAIVFHEKEGRRHCHAVWSRIDADAMKAVPLPFTKQKLQDISRELFLEHGWRMPRGLMKSEERDPRNFTLAEWQQAKRAGDDPRVIKTAIQDCWAISDSRQALSAALEERGYKLARGDRRGYVAVDAQGEVYALARWAGVKTKDVRARIGDENDLPSVAQCKAELTEQVATRLQQLKDQQDNEHLREQEELAAARRKQIEEHRGMRQSLLEAQGARWEQESITRQERFNRGIRGLWDRLIGRHDRIKAQNEAETLAAYLRDRSEKDILIFAQLEERQALKQRYAKLQEQRSAQRGELTEDIKRYETLRQDARRAMLDEFRRRRDMPKSLEQDRQDGGHIADERRVRLESLREDWAERASTPPAPDGNPKPVL